VDDDAGLLREVTYLPTFEAVNAVAANNQLPPTEPSLL